MGVLVSLVVPLFGLVSLIVVLLSRPRDGAAGRQQP